MNLYIPSEIFWIIAGAWSLYFGLWAFEIHSSSMANNNHRNYTQYFFNGLGALLGWVALYFLLKLDWSNPSNFGFQHLILSYIAFVGITGNLPFVSKFSKT